MSSVSDMPLELLEHARPEELAEYEAALQLELALVSPLSYATHISPWVERFAYLEYLDKLIVELTEGRLLHPQTGEIVHRLGVSMPPRHGKSTLISEHTPPWFLSRYPDRKVMLASYEADFASTWGRKARTHVEEHPEFGPRLNPQSKAASRWELLTPHRGEMFTAGVGGPVTGRGAHLLIIDDPVKNAEEAQSEIMREKAWDWALSTALTRLEPGGNVIILQTRWHEDDLLGRFIQSEPEKWYYLNLPAIAFEDDPLNRAPGEALCPSRYPIEALNDVRETQGTYWFGALYQGRPSTEGSGIFKKPSFRYWSYQIPPGGGNPTHIELLDRHGTSEFVNRKGLTRFQTIDLAATVKSSSDFSVISTWDVTKERDLLLVDRVRQRLEAADHRDWFLTHYRRLKPKWVGVEKATYGLALIQELLRLGIPVRELKPDGDKVSRAIPAGTIIDGGRVFFPRHAEWLEEWEHELLSFPYGTHDDQVDTLSYAANVVTLGVLSHVAYNPEKQPTTLEQRLRAYVDKNQKHKRRLRRSGGANPLGRWS